MKNTPSTTPSFDTSIRPAPGVPRGRGPITPSASGPKRHEQQHTCGFSMSQSTGAPEQFGATQMQVRPGVILGGENGRGEKRVQAS